MMNCFGRVALGPLRPFGFASLRQPDACGAGESRRDRHEFSTKDTRVVESGGLLSCVFHQS